MSKVFFYAEIEVQKHFSQKNDQTIRKKFGSRKKFISKGEKTKKYRRLLVNALSLAYKGETFTGPVNAAIKFFYGMNKDGKPTFRVIDLTNLEAGVEDSLQKAGIISDDKNILSKDGSGRFHHDGPPMIIVELTDLSDDKRATKYTKVRSGEIIQLWTLNPDFDYGSGKRKRKS